eukprot:GHVU01151714.1.p1 GENE.GHVU01151714.1~~GHVU01151714.1.p1  ORF type:complete len:252 (+),score=34.93 GHVU01151714.1:246-1001(+)
MASMSAGYDLSVSTFSPDGRVFQIEYASNAVDNSGVAVALTCKDGVLLGVEKLVLSKLLVKGTSRRVFAVDKHATIAVAGFVADARQIVERAREEARNYRRTFAEAIPGRVLADRLGLLLHAYTLYWSVRPFGASVLLAVHDQENGGEPELYAIDPSGSCYKYFAMAIGKGRQTAKTELEKLKLSELTCKEAVFHVCKILHQVHEDNKDRKMEMELGWISPESGNKFDYVPQNLIDEAGERALRQLETMEE